MSDLPTHLTALDSEEQEVGELYARAFLGSAGDAADEAVLELTAIVTECLDAHPDLETALGSPRIGQDQKEEMINRIFQGRVSANTLNFLKVLCRRGRVGSLRSVQMVATELREQQLGKQRVTVISAQELNDDQRNSIRAGFQAAYGKEAVLMEKIDASLLGGIVLRVGDELIDGSVLGKMNSIRAAVSNGVQRSVREHFESLLSS